MKKALIFQGGWEGHEPEQVAEILKGILVEEQFNVKVTDTLDTLAKEDLGQYDLIVPNWTQGTITNDQLEPLLNAIKNGTGLAGLHGGMGDSFRMATEYQFMVGGQWVAHPGNDGVTYTVHIVDGEHPLTKGMNDFEVTSEQYYMHVDPVVWSKSWGKGRVYYCSLGHVAHIVRMPEVIEFMRKGMGWAAR